MQTARALVRVLGGSKALDAAYGDHWRHDVDPDTINIESAFKCPLGQLYDDFNLGVERLVEVGLVQTDDDVDFHEEESDRLVEPDWDDVVRLGFVAGDGMNDEELTDTWKYHLRHQAAHPWIGRVVGHYDYGDWVDVRAESDGQHRVFFLPSSSFIGFDLDGSQIGVIYEYAKIVLVEVVAPSGVVKNIFSMDDEESNDGHTNNV